MTRRIAVMFITTFVSLAPVPLCAVLAEAKKTENPRAASLLQLIADPAKWHGRLLEVSGWLEVREEETALYFHREDADMVIVENAIWVNVTPTTTWQRESRRYCIVVGRFSATDHGHLGAFPFLVPTLCVSFLFPRSAWEHTI